MYVKQNQIIEFPVSGTACATNQNSKMIENSILGFFSTSISEPAIFESFFPKVKTLACDVCSFDRLSFSLGSGRKTVSASHLNHGPCQIFHGTFSDVTR